MGFGLGRFGPNWELVEFKMLDLSDRSSAGISIWTSVADYPRRFYPTEGGLSSRRLTSGIIRELLFPSGHQPLTTQEGFIQQKTDWAQDAGLQWLNKNWYFHLDIIPWQLNGNLTFFCNRMTEVHFFSRSPEYFLSMSPGMSDSRLNASRASL